MSNTVTREQVRNMLRKMLPEFKLEFDPLPGGERAAESVLTEPSFIELSSDDLEEDDPRQATLGALARLAARHGDR